MCFTKGSEVDLAETIIMINASAFKQAPAKLLKNAQRNHLNLHNKVA
jgi:hypothetical protein